MANLTTDGKVISSGPGYDGTLRSWRLMQHWLEVEMRVQWARVRNVRKGQ